MRCPVVITLARAAILALAMTALQGCIIDTHISRPTAVVVTPRSTLLLSDRANDRLLEIDLQGRVRREIRPSSGSRVGFRKAYDIALDRDGSIYTLSREDTSVEEDHGSESIAVFDEDGNLLRELGAERYTSADDHITTYWGVAVDDRDTVFIADFGQSALHVLDRSGAVLDHIRNTPGPGHPALMGVMDTAIDIARRVVYIIEGSGSHIQKYSYLHGRDGSVKLKHLKTFGKYGRDLGDLFYPESMAVAPHSGQLYVTEIGNQRVQIFDQEGQALKVIDPPKGTKDGKWIPMGIAVVPNGDVYVTDTYNDALWRFTQSGDLVGKVEIKR